MCYVEERLLRQHAERCVEKSARRVIRGLQGFGRDHMQSGLDSGLRNPWDEICGQAQGEESVFWHLYLDLMDQEVPSAVGRLTRSDQEAIWLQTEEGELWLGEHNESDFLRIQDRDNIPVCDDDIDDLVRDRVLEIAMDYSNGSIRAFHRR